MGCGSTKIDNRKPEFDHSGSTSSKSQTTLRSAILIQNWFRRYRARLEARRRCTWKIFQSIEYAGEQDQLKLFNFFSDMMTHVQQDNNIAETRSSVITDALKREGSPINKSVTSDNDTLERLTDPETVPVPSNYSGIKIKLPLSIQTINKLMNHYKLNKQLHAKYVLVILREAREKFKVLPNIQKATTSIAKQITVCGDLHGKLDDLFTIFSKNGVPSSDNPYVFNGDLVDRGPRSIEIVIILFAYMILYPTGVYINRGNHEDHIMNLRYGFIKEVMEKYQEHSNKILKLLEDIFGWLPLGTVINNKIFVTHGGISNITDLEIINRIDRHKYVSILKPPGMSGKQKPSMAQLMEWRQVLDLLWSDPKPNLGCKPNTFRGGGCYFGPDVTTQVLRKHKFDLLVRSHECKYEGFEYTHDDKVVTVFSASNYYEQSSNRGAYMRIEHDEKPYFVQFQTSSQDRRLTLKKRVSIVEESAIRELREKLYANKRCLMTAFEEKDKENTGYLTASQWASVVEDTLQLEVPWNMVKHQLARILPDGRVDYASCLDQYSIEGKADRNGPSITEALYRNRSNLETIFRLMDKDNSGHISMEEFEEGCRLLNQHVNTQIPEKSIQDLAKSIDLDNDGFIDFNEFLEAFRLVDINVSRNGFAH
ncbi:serine/threonine-protein phosphatase with EF-hands 2-like [Actinia tenebrosa]|uniref:Serine/threonine-protein phosphatase with EF-hands n=1 Tax=Actinia tenebrosa TaxID=6105 RepID=A0A6P8HC17_ACTTE|nr:serine/threonine-protein phosphatase with EF-hands 2-like [Actinia tenebrosa]